MICRILLATITIALGVHIANARDGPVGLGEGIISCGRWSADRKNYTQPAFSATDTAWLLGFISAFNLYMLNVDDDVARSSDTRGMTAWIDNYCAMHPLDSLESAAASLIDELVRRTGAH
jgi:hypothetical protein